MKNELKENERAIALKGLKAVIEFDYDFVESGYYLFKSLVDFYSNDVENDFRLFDSLADLLGYDYNRFLQDVIKLNNTFAKMYNNLCKDPLYLSDGDPIAYEEILSKMRSEISSIRKENQLIEIKLDLDDPKYNNEFSGTFKDKINEFIRLSDELEIVVTFDAVRFDELKAALIADDSQEYSLVQAVDCMVILAKELKKLVADERG